jgi:uncharacterized protein
MHPLEIINRYYNQNEAAYDILLSHGEKVADKGLDIAARVSHLEPDTAFIEEAALLHDIGMFLTRSPALGCYGAHPYVSHGYLGRELLEKEGWGRHALVCERHVGVGITREDIIRQKLPLPDRDMLPCSIEEKIICYADKFFSKNCGSADREKSVEEILENLKPYGQDKVKRFRNWFDIFEK